MPGSAADIVNKLVSCRRMPLPAEEERACPVEFDLIHAKITAVF